MTIDFLTQLLTAGLPEPQVEVPVCPGRRWKFDFAYPEIFLAIEFEGGTWTGGRHVRGKGYENDARKYNEATIRGWRVLRFTADMVKSGEALATIERLFSALRTEQAGL
jgi:very-short-patch-repair endonuclease